jgi:hypothetical protein
LLSFGINSVLISWIANFLTDRLQFTVVNSSRSDITITNTGSPQGCVLSALLFIAYTNDYQPKSPNIYALKYADDTALIGLISNNDDSAYLDEVHSMVSWCDDNFLHLNVKKTKELVFDFRKKKSPTSTLSIKSSPIEKVATYKYLGVLISNDLKWESHVDSVLKKASQRLFYLKKLRSFGLPAKILQLFYSSFIQPVLTYNITVWYQCLPLYLRKKLDRIIKRAAKISKGKPNLMSDLSENRIKNKLHSILDDQSHFLYQCFTFLNSGRLRQLKLSTNRFANSFVPHAISSFNSTFKRK